MDGGEEREYTCYFFFIQICIYLNIYLPESFSGLVAVHVRLMESCSMSTNVNIGASILLQSHCETTDGWVE